MRPVFRAQNSASFFLRQSSPYAVRLAVKKGVLPAFADYRALPANIFCVFYAPAPGAAAFPLGVKKQLGIHGVAFSVPLPGPKIQGCFLNVSYLHGQTYAFHKPKDLL